MKIGVVGVGKVGSAIAFGFRRIGHEVLEHDVKLNTKLKDVLPASLVFVCVPTPPASDGSCVTRYVDDVVRDLSSAEYGGLVVIKSTVPPGTTDRLSSLVNLAFCPEFLRERAAFSDFVENNDVCISGVYIGQDAALIEEAHGSLPKSFVRMRPIEAELCKYFCNTFNALRIVFANQFYDVCKAVGADYATIKNAVVKRHDMVDHYLECNKEFRAFGGNCLPKDTSAFSEFIRSIGVDAQLFKMIVDINATINKPEPMTREEWLWAKNTWRSGTHD